MLLPSHMHLRSSEGLPILILLKKDLFMIMHSFYACSELELFYRLNVLVLIQLNTIAYGFRQEQAVEVCCIRWHPQESYQGMWVLRSCEPQ